MQKGSSMSPVVKPVKKNSSKTDRVVVQVRIDADLASQAKRLSKEAGDESVSDFFRRAIETEASKTTLCIPTADVTLADLARKVGQMHDLMVTQDQHNRTNAALLKLVCLAVGVRAD